MVMNVCHMVSRTLSLLKIEGAKQFKEMKKKIVCQNTPVSRNDIDTAIGLKFFLLVTSF